MPLEGIKEMKTLVVYIKDSYYKFEAIFDTHLYTLEGSYLNVFQVSKIDGTETLVAVFRSWDYFIIEQ